MSKRVLIVTGEASGDLHGAGLAKEMFRMAPGIRILGLGGERMREAGVEIIFDNRRLGVMGAMDVVRKWRVVLRAFSRVKREINEGSLDGIILIDSPDFNFRVARTAKRKGIPVAYYIGPKFWAWRPGRVKTIARLIDRMLVIFPFEKPFYDRAGVSCEYVGNPLMDTMAEPVEDKGMDPVSSVSNAEERRKEFGLSPGVPVLGLLPGSRPMEIERLFGLMLESFDKVRESIPNIEGVIPVAPSISLSDLRQRIGNRGDRIRLVEGRTPEVLGVSDAALVASGTATLEAAIMGTPAVVVYKVGLLTELIGRLLIRVKYVSLVNIIAGKRVVPEFLQSAATPGNLARAVLDPLQNQESMEKIKKDLSAVRRALGAPGAAGRAATNILGLISAGPGEVGI